MLYLSVKYFNSIVATRASWHKKRITQKTGSIVLTKYFKKNQNVHVAIVNFKVMDWMREAESVKAIVMTQNITQNKNEHQQCCIQ